MKAKTRRWFRDLFTENISYKVVSLLIALILWITIIGRRDFVYTKTMDVEIRPAPELTVVAQTADRVRLRVSGSRAALKRFIESPSTQTLVLDVTDRSPGVVDVDVPINKIVLPAGLKVLSVRPNVIRAEITRRPEQ